ncbi:hypothetical protein HBI72_211740 [Parastagonospora nodorum]|nr:hypothetical protein HBI72_211740 [Parastagonospora nodorum]
MDSRGHRSSSIEPMEQDWSPTTCLPRMDPIAPYAANQSAHCDVPGSSVPPQPQRCIACSKHYVPPSSWEIPFRSPKPPARDARDFWTRDRKVGEKFKKDHYEQWKQEHEKCSAPPAEHINLGVSEIPSGERKLESQQEEAEESMKRYFDGLGLGDALDFSQ